MRFPDLRDAFLAAAFLSLSHTLGAQASKRSADLVVTNARIYTVDPTRPQADALAVRDGRFLFVGSKRGALALKGAGTRVLDATGRTIVPGIVDAHGHLMGLGQALRTVDLVGTTSYADVVARVVARAKQVPAGSWILGRG